MCHGVLRSRRCLLVVFLLQISAVLVQYSGAVQSDRNTMRLWYVVLNNSLHSCTYIIHASVPVLCLDLTDRFKLKREDEQCIFSHNDNWTLILWDYHAEIVICYGHSNGQNTSQKALLRPLCDRCEECFIRRELDVSECCHVCVFGSFVLRAAQMCGWRVRRRHQASLGTAVRDASSLADDWPQTLERPTAGPT